MFADVSFPISSYVIFSDKSPKSLSGKVAVGMRVKAMFGRRKAQGIVVEIKKTMIGKECRINHMAFLGDSILEDFGTIGAGVITCNNDGLQTNETYIESNSFIGSNVNLIAPLRI